LTRFRLWVAVFSGLCCWMLLSGISAAADTAPSRVLLFPFTIHAEKDLSFLNNGIQSMLAARLNRQGAVEVTRAKQAVADEAEALKIGTARGATHVLTGTLTIFGNSVSTDAAMLDVQAGQARLRFSESGAESGDVIRHVDQLARRINQEVFAVAPKTAEAVASAPQAATPQPTPATAATAAKTVPTKPVPAAPESVEGPRIWKSNLLNTSLRGLTAGDINGDGAVELAAIDSEAVYVHRRTGDDLTQLSIYKANRGDQLIGVDAADLNANGKTELYVTALGGGGQLASFVLEWDGSLLRNIARDLNWYFRAIDAPDGRRVLIGQQRGSVMTSSTASELEDQDRLFRGDVVELTWRGDRLEPGHKIAVPRGMNVFSFTRADALNDGRQVLVGFDDNNHLVIVGDTGRREYKSPESFGGSLNYLEYPSGSQFTAADRYYLPLRVHVADLDGDGINDIVAARNKDQTRNLLSRYRTFGSGQLVCLNWEKIALKEKWASEPVADFVADTALADFDGDGRPEAAFAVSTSGGFLESAQSYIVTYKP
jgi:TolB-like protein